MDIFVLELHHSQQTQKAIASGRSQSQGDQGTDSSVTLLPPPPPQILFALTLMLLCCGQIHLLLLKCFLPQHPHF